MTTQGLQEINIKLQEKVCPDCGSELNSDNNCPICNPESEEEPELLDEEKSEDDKLE